MTTMRARAVRHLVFIVVLTLGPLVWLGVTSSWTDGIVFGAIGGFFGLMMFSRLGRISIPVTIVGRPGRPRRCPGCGADVEETATVCGACGAGLPPA